MNTGKGSSSTAVAPATYSFGENPEQAMSSQAMAGPVKRIVNLGSLSRREAQVALCCAQGLTNAEIGARLQVGEQTIKFHLRNIFVKFGVKRRADLVSRLFRDRGSSIDLSL